MGLEEIVGRINGEAAERSAKIVADAKAEADRIVADAKEKASSILSQARARAEREVKNETLRSVASARLSAKRELLQAREDVLRRYEEGVGSSIDGFVGSRRYGKFLARAVEDGVTKIGKDAVVRVNSKDRRLLKGKRLGGKLSAESLDCKGGALVTSADGKRRVDNTIESILRERGDVIRLKLVEQVFGDGRNATGG